MIDTNFFTEGSPFLKHPLLTPERTSAEIDFVVERARLAPGASIFDVGCGFGRHSIELAKRGYNVVGVDPSSALLEEANNRAKDAGVEVAFVQSKAEAFTTNRVFDAAICLFTTLGQIDESGDNIGLIKRVSETLVDGGIFIVEVPQRIWVINNLKVEERIGEGERYADVKRRYDGQKQTLTETFTVVKGGQRDTYTLCYRLYRYEDLRYLLLDAHLNLTALYGGFDASPLSDESPVQVVVAKKDASYDPYDILQDIR